MNEAQEQLARLLSQAATSVPRFPPSSRYHATGITSLVAADGETVPYLRRRFVPQAETLALLREHTVVEGDRVDRLAATHLQDPELFWRLCDANRAVRPADLTAVPGRRLRITMPEGIPGDG